MDMTAIRSRIVIIAITFLITLGFARHGALSKEKGAVSAPTAAREKAVTKGKALCVGINKFKNLDPAEDWLRGCVNDANNMEALLIKWKGLAPGDIVKLTDAQATKANIMHYLKEMVEGAKRGKFNYLVFSLSSHGMQVPDLDNDEEDGLDEAICAYDLAVAPDRKWWAPETYISDDEFRNLFAELPKNVLLEVFLDTCHSGTGIKIPGQPKGIKVRWIAPPSGEALQELENRSLRGVKKTFMDKGLKAQHILWAACKSNERSQDMPIGGDYHGLFTYAYCKVMNKNPNLDRQEVLMRVRDEVEGKSIFPQTPQLEIYRK